MKSEFKLIEKIASWIPRRLQGVLPIGDDAGVLNFPKGEEMVSTVDTIIEGVDFYASPSKKKKLGYLSAEMAGRKALAINLSDMAAMGAKPFACVISLGIPKNWKESWIRGFYKGLVKLAEAYNVNCCGGDITSSRDFFASISLVGTAKKSEIVTRSGAKPGDWIAVTGALGGSLVRKHYAFQPRIHEARFLSRQFKPSAMMDISDGLLQDLAHLLKASRAGARLEMLEIPMTYEAVALAKSDPMKAFERACTDGEDFELLLTVSKNKRSALEESWRRHFPELPLSWIGQVTGKKEKIDWIMAGKNTAPPKFKRKGFEHF